MDYTFNLRRVMVDPYMCKGSKWSKVIQFKSCRQDTDGWTEGQTYRHTEAVGNKVMFQTAI